MMSNRIDMVKGDNEDRRITITRTSDGAGVDLTTAEVRMSVKKNATDSNYYFQRKNTAAGGGDTEIEMTDPTNGICLLKIVPANTQDMPAGNYVFDVEIIHSVYGTKTPIKDNFILKEDVTKP